MLLRVKDLHCLSSIGVRRWEKAIKRTLILNLEMSSKSTFLDYSLVLDGIRDFCLKYKTDYIEDFAESIVSFLTREFFLDTCKIIVSKPYAFGFLNSSFPSVEFVAQIEK